MGPKSYPVLTKRTLKPSEWNAMNIVLPMLHHHVSLLETLAHSFIFVVCLTRDLAPLRGVCYFKPATSDI